MDTLWGGGGVPLELYTPVWFRRKLPLFGWVSISVLLASVQLVGINLLPIRSSAGARLWEFQFGVGALCC